jgi:hypothetical protein
MVKLIKEKIKYLFPLITGIMLSSCALQLPPGGGEVDKIPPKITEVYPANGTTNFKDDHFKVKFSEYVDKRTFQDALFISPAVEGSPDYDWTGTTVDVTFSNKLKKNKTYVVTIGTDLVDYNNHNRMAQAYSFAFSTGDRIDKGEIKGRVYDEKPDGILIFAYEKGDSTVNPMVRKPDYISQTGKNGAFKLMGLAPADYRVFAVKDNSGEYTYKPDQDEVGIPYSDITLTKSDTLFTGMNFFLTKLDTIKPRLVSAIMTDNYHMLLNFSKEIDSTTMRSNNFYFIDSTSKKTSKPVYSFKGNTKPTEMVLVTNDNFQEKDEVYVFADTVRDKIGNYYTNDFTSVTISEKPDTTKPGIYKTIPRANSGSVDFKDAQISFYFNDAFDTSAVKKLISFSDTSGNKIVHKIKFMDNASFVISPLKELKANTYYLIKMKLNGFKDAAGNSYDSLYQFKFKTINGLDFTGVTGTVINANMNKNPQIVLQGIESEKMTYNKSVSNTQFDFERVQPGKYFLWGYYDTDSTKTYTYGKPFPYKPSEEFFFYPDTLNLRPRWTVTNINISFGKK